MFLAGPQSFRKIDGFDYPKVFVETLEDKAQTLSEQSLAVRQ